MSNLITGPELRSRRLAAGLTQEKLSRLADVATYTVRLLEAGYAPRKSAARDRILAAIEKCDAPAGQGERAATATNASLSVVPTTDPKVEVDDARV